MVTRLVFACAAFAMATPSWPEIEKIATPCERGLCLTWWPKVVAMPGWHHERKASLQYGSNAFAPDGSTFSNAEVVIYARALYKPRMPKIVSVAQLMADDQREFLTRDPTIAVSELPTLTTADGQKMRSVSFIPKGKGNWERVTYGEEAEFFLLFTISSPSFAGYRQKQADYEGLIVRYRATPKPPGGSQHE